ncbi:MAG: hypothetical protein HON76_11570 [Candidatus Scalindua sp.]|jgi:hypothetical protein|nr:hypothetical protein [Candidatus Scalindua sp.]MBT5307614.1 hypothetical protein [Candidatus Scalindua sp.]MBT6050840.1 hypothetical protein [Candidatus Scalindua sp.]MBT6229843.1 hypothetical protein [Candidatus Scalindua sp.]MBT6563151.1 hypothetical protein [Candidatus Scalindua sp.]
MNIFNKATSGIGGIFKDLNKKLDKLGNEVNKTASEEIYKVIEDAKNSEQSVEPAAIAKIGQTAIKQAESTLNEELAHNGFKNKLIEETENDIKRFEELISKMAKVASSVTEKGKNGWDEAKKKADEVGLTAEAIKNGFKSFTVGGGGGGELFFGGQCSINAAFNLHEADHSANLYAVGGSLGASIGGEAGIELGIWLPKPVDLNGLGWSIAASAGFVVGCSVVVNIDINGHFEGIVVSPGMGVDFDFAVGIDYTYATDNG